MKAKKDYPELDLIDRLSVALEEASPRLIPDIMDGFTMKNTEDNRAFYEKHSKKIKEILEEDEGHIIFRTGDKRNGYFAGYDKGEKLIYYVLKYRQAFKTLTGQVFMEVLHWRLAAGSKYSTKDLTQRMYFKIVLPRAGAILSDGKHTYASRRFWEGLLSTAFFEGLPIGVVDFNKRTIIRPEEGESVKQFIDTYVDSTYGKKHKHRAMKLLIGPIPVTESWK